MSQPLGQPDDDPLNLEGVDREIRIGKLRREIDEIAGGEMMSGQAADCDPKVEEAFLEHVLALETHGFICPFETLVKNGFGLPSPEKLDDSSLTTKLWELINTLARHRLFLHSTNHLSDRELYTWLWSDALREELMGFGLPFGNCHLDVLGGCSEEDIILSLRYYTNDEDRARWAKDFPDFPSRFPGKKFIGTETVSALATRGHYDLPSDSIRRWPSKWDKPLVNGNPDTTCSAYDNCSAPWGSTQEETWKIIRKYDFLSGQYIWTGWDYIGEPTPYPWPARSSYFGIIDLAGFPKDVYYMYQSEWTNKPVLHIFPHWNWKKGDTVDVWAYYNNADEAELFLNNKSLGIKKKTGDDLHVMWRIPFEPGTLRAVSRMQGKTVLTKEIKTAGAPARIELSADRNKIKADGDDLSFVTVRILDAAGNIVPTAGSLVHFSLQGNGTIAGTDNGWETDLASFQSKDRKAFNGLCLAVLRNSGVKGKIQLTATAEGLKPATVTINVE